MSFDFKKYSLLKMEAIDENFHINFIADQYPDIFKIITNSMDLAVILQNHCLSFDDCNIFSDFFNSSDLTLNQKSDLIELIDTLVVNDFIEKNESIFNLILFFLSTNENPNEITGSIFDCMVDVICPYIIKIFPNNFYDIIKESNDDNFISQIAFKISENLPWKNSSAKIRFIEFLIEISETVNDDTAFFIYSSHSNIYFLFPDYFPLLDLDFYINGINYDLETQSEILSLLSYSKNCSEIFEDPQIQNAIFLGIQNKESALIMSQSIRVLANMLKENVSEFKKNYIDNGSFQQLITHLDSLIFDSSFDIKSDASYLLSLLICAFPRFLINNVLGEFTPYNEMRDIRSTMIAIFDLELPVLSIKLLYGLESIFLYASKKKIVDQFILKINEFEILDRINDLTDNENLDVAKTAIIVLNEISGNVKIMQ